MARKGGTPENLKPFKEGFDERRNLNGPPRKLPELKDVIDHLFGCEDGELPKSVILDVIKPQLAKAKKGDSRAAELILGYAFGKPKQVSEISGKDGGAIETKTLVIEIPADGGK